MARRGPSASLVVCLLALVLKAHAADSVAATSTVLKAPTPANAFFTSKYIGAASQAFNLLADSNTTQTVAFLAGNISSTTSPENFGHELSIQVAQDYSEDLIMALGLIINPSLSEAKQVCPTNLTAADAADIAVGLAAAVAYAQFNGSNIGAADTVASANSTHVCGRCAAVPVTGALMSDVVLAGLYTALKPCGAPDKAQNATETYNTVLTRFITNSCALSNSILHPMVLELNATDSSLYTVFTNKLVASRRLSKLTSPGSALPALRSFELCMNP